MILHGLTTPDLRRQNNVNRRVMSGRSSQRPIARKRRGPQGGSGPGGATLQIGQLQSIIPAGSFSGGLPNPGRAATPDVRLLVQSDTNHFGYQFAEDAEGEVSYYTGVNFSKTPIRASAEEPIAVIGYVANSKGDGSGIEVFIICNLMDFRALPEYDAAKRQIAWHNANLPFSLAAQVCGAT